MWLLSFLLLITFKGVFEDLETVLIPWLLFYISMLFVIELLVKIIYLCEVLVFYPKIQLKASAD